MDVAAVLVVVAYVGIGLAALCAVVRHVRKRRETEIQPVPHVHTRQRRLQSRRLPTTLNVLLQPPQARWASLPRNPLPAQVQADATTLFFKDWDLDVHALGLEGTTLQTICNAAYQRFHLSNLHAFNTGPAGVALPQWTALIQHLESTYEYQGEPNPYHNSLHAADVVHTVCMLCTQASVYNVLSMFDMFALILGAAIHDYNHAGSTNAYLVQSGHPIAIMFSDDSVLERHHLYNFFAVVQTPELNVFSQLPVSCVRTLRSTLIELVLSTDLARSREVYASFDLAMGRYEESGAIDHDGVRLALLQMLVKCADVSHPTKHRTLHLFWTRRITEEFFRQGDMERSEGLTVTPLCDKHSVNVAASQCGFVDFVVRRPFEALYRFTGSTSVSNVWQQHLKSNYAFWERLAQSETLAAGHVPNPASAATVDRQITDTLNADKRLKAQKTRVLVLGTGNSGKTTLVKQMLLQYDQTFASPSNRAVFTHILRANIQDLASAFSQPSIQRRWTRTLRRSSERFDASTLQTQLDTAIRSKLEPNSSSLPPNAKYLLTNFRRILSDDYVPTVKDVLHCRQPTRGVQCHNLSVHETNLEFIDVGGQQSERRKWIHMFDCVGAIVYVASLTDYATPAPTPFHNALNETLSVFESVLAFAYFQRTPIILMLNKSDLLEDTLQRHPFRTSYGHGPADGDPSSVYAYIAAKFHRAHERSQHRGELLRFKTVATDTDNAIRTWKAWRHCCLMESLTTNGLV